MAVPVPVTGIHQAMRIVDKEFADAALPTTAVFARSIKVRTAGDALELLGFQAAPGLGKKGRAVANRTALEYMDRAGHVLQLLDKSILVDLAAVPTKPGLLAVVEASARRLRQCAEEAGGNLCVNTKGVALQLDHFVALARSHTKFGDYAPLLDAINNLRFNIRKLLDSTCTLRETEKAGGKAAAAAEDQGAAA